MPALAAIPSVELSDTRREVRRRRLWQPLVASRLDEAGFVGEDDRLRSVA